jgi:hypothetical protein
MKKVRELIQLIESDGSSSLNEASFSAGKTKKVADLLASLLGSYLGGEFKQMGGSFGTETFKKKKFGEGRGYKYMNKSGNMIRFGWMKKSKSIYQITQVDFWEANSGAKWDTPSISVNLADWMNIVDVVNELKEVLVHGAVTEDLNESIKDSNKPPKKMLAYGASIGVDYDEEVDTYQGYINKMKASGKYNADDYKGFKVVKNETEQNSTSSNIKKAEKLLAERKFADPDVVFEDIEKLTKVVGAGMQNGLIVAGMAGIGKTFHVEKAMKELFGSPNGPNAKWRHRKGEKLSPFGLYMDLFANREDMTIVYDDSDSVWKDPDSVNILKSAMDTYKVRTLGWTSKSTTNVEILDDEEKQLYYDKLYSAMKDRPEEVGTKVKLPNKFDFSSRIIFISNLKPNQIDSAIRSRSLFMDIYLTQTDVVKRIKSILPFVEPDISMDVKLQVLESLEKSGGELTMRAVTAGIGVASMKFDDWERLVSNYA